MLRTDDRIKWRNLKVSMTIDITDVTDALNDLDFQLSSLHSITVVILNKNIIFYVGLLFWI